MTRKRKRPPAPPTRPPQRPRRRRDWLPGAAVVAVIVLGAVWAWSTSFGGVLVLDDVRAIALNPTIRTLWPPPLVPPGASTVAGRPVANVTFALNYAFGDPELRDLWGYHFVNLAIHIGAALALFGIVQRSLGTDRMRERFGRSARPLAAAIALIWMVHPLQTESVTYLVQRVESLMGLFYLLTIYCAIRATEGSRAGLWTIAAAVACALGMATKEVMVTAPVVVAVWYYVFTPGTAGSGTRLRVLSALAVTWIVFAILVLHEYRAPSLALSAGMAWRYLLTQSEVVLHYLKLSFWPSPLVFLYTWPLAPSLGSVAAAAIAIVLLLVLTIAGVMRRHPLGFAGAWFFVILAPTSSVVPIATEVAAEHRMYLPLAAVVAAVVLSAYALARSRTPRVAGIAIAAIVFALLGTETRARNRDYWSAEQLWRDTVEKQPNNQRARVAYGSALAAAGRIADAEAEFRRAVELDANDGLAHGRLGTALAAQERFDDAVKELERALQLRPDDADAHRVLGQIFAARRDDDRAASHLARALELGGDRADLLTGLAAILADSRDVTVRDAPRALALAERAVALTGRRDPFALDVLSVAQAGVGRFGDAAATAREALPLARAQRNEAMVRELEYRAETYGMRAR